MARRGRSKQRWWGRSPAARAVQKAVERVFTPGDLVMKGPPGAVITDDTVDLALVIRVTETTLIVLTPVGGAVWQKTETRRVFPYKRNEASPDEEFEDTEEVDE
jgi:hypothetical protein